MLSVLIFSTLALAMLASFCWSAWTYWWPPRNLLLTVTIVLGGAAVAWFGATIVPAADTVRGAMAGGVTGLLLWALLLFQIKVTWKIRKSDELSSSRRNLLTAFVWAFPIGGAMHANAALKGIVIVDPTSVDPRTPYW